MTGLAAPTPRLRDDVIQGNAKQFLGHGFHKPSQKILGRVVEDISPDSVHVSEYRSSYEAEIDANIEQAAKRLHYRVKLNFGGGYVPIATGGIDVNLNLGEKKSETEARKFVCAATAYVSARCMINGPAFRRRDLPAELQGDGYVKSGLIYTGYWIVIEICTQSQSDKAENSQAVKAQAAFINSLVTAESSGERLKSEFQGRRITQVHIIKAEGFGDYVPPLQEFKTIRKLDKMTDIINNLRTHFINSLPGINRLNFLIDPTVDLEAYHRLKLTPSVIPLLQPRGLTSQSVSSAMSLHFVDPFELFDKLAKAILAEYPQEEKESIVRVFKNVNLAKMLFAISNVFSSTFEGMSDDVSEDDSVLVVGKSGVGKSLLIGYLLDKEVKKEVLTTPTKKKIVVYDYTSKHPDAPAIGHTRSETKGSRAYGKYIDTAGYIDTSGLEADSCNAIAIDMITKLRNPNRLILVLPSSVFDGRAQEFTALIKTLRRILPRSKKTILPSLLFVINNRNPVIDGATGQPIGVDFIMGNIEKAIQSEQEHIQELMPKKIKQKQGWIEWFFGSQEQQNVQDSEMNEEKINPTIIESRENIEILKQITEQNILIADFENSETREKISNWVTDPLITEHSPLSFDMENLVQEGSLTFNTTISIALHYFNRLLDQKKDLEAKIEETRHLIKKQEEELSAPKQKAKTPTDKQTLLGVKDGLKKERVELEKKQRDLMGQLDELRKNPTEDTFLEPLVPEPTLTYRVWWHLWFQIRSTFKYKGGCPLAKVERSNDVKGQWDNEKRGVSEYQIDYCPTFRGWGENLNATVNVYVQKQNHPNIIIQINDAQKKLDVINRDLDDPNSTLNTKIKDNEDGLKNLKASKAVRKQAGLEQKAKYQQKEANLLSELSKVTETLESYRDFCKLLVKILRARDCGETERLNKTAFSSFKENVDRLWAKGTAQERKIGEERESKKVRKEETDGLLKTAQG